MRHAIIMAGGAGTRLWPLSRRRRPKHFLRFVGGRSLMRLAYERLATVLGPEQINVVTSADHLDLVAGELPELPRCNLIGEPAVRDTANAVGLAAVILEQRDPEGTMGVFTADHVIPADAAFREALERAYTAAETHANALVTFGVTPTCAHTGYGYVHRGQQLGPHLFAVEEFKEKPDRATAEGYVASGEYYWNSGMFVWRLDTILREFERHLPANLRDLRRVAAPAADRAAVCAQVYPNLDRISIDYGIMEKADTVLVTAMTSDWLDVGSWTALDDLMPRDDHGQVHAAPEVISIDAARNIYVCEDNHLIAAIGVEDLVIVHAGDATLVCHRDHVQKIKDLVGRLTPRHT